MSILEDIFANKRLEVDQAILSVPLEEMRAAAARMTPAQDFIGALKAACKRNSFPAIIAEIKAASPSRGLLVADFDPLHLAEIYATNGAAAVSVLTDERYFKGHLDHLRQVRERFPKLMLLRKDFIFHPYQVYEARAAGADAVLLIVAGLEVEQLQDLQALAQRLGMAALVEVHTKEEMETALASEVKLIGINNRSLHTFHTNLQTTIELFPMVPPHVTVVAESGIYNPEDVEQLYKAGIDAILVGEALVTAPDTAAKLRALCGQATRPV